MKKDEVKIGSIYKVKVSGVLAEVRINGVNPHGGWDGMNTKTHRRVRIGSAGRLRGLVDRSDKKQVATLAEHEAEIAADKAAKGAQAAEDRPRATKAKKATKEPKVAAERDTGESRRAGTKGTKRTSGLDAAAQVLAEADEPINTKDMVERMLAKGLWKTNGRTPAATIYAAIIREIAAKGSDSRFRKTERGKFELAK